MNLLGTDSNLNIRILRWAGRYYPVAAVLLARLMSSTFGLVISQIITRNNNDFSPEQYNLSLLITIVLFLLGDILVAAATVYYTRDIALRLEQWKAGKTTSDTQTELRAWRQSNGILWNYSMVAIPAAGLVNILPLLIFQSYSLKATPNQLIYSALGTGLAALISIGISILVVEYLMRPTRTLLLPSNFEQQIKGAIGARLRTKLILNTLALLGISILALAPLGYSRTYRVLYEAIGSFNTLTELQVSLIVASLAISAIGVFMAFSTAETATTSIHELTEVFRKVEKGDLKQRARVIASDELGELAIYFNRMLERIEALQSNLEKRVDEQTEKLRASNEVGRIASTILDPDVLVSRVVNLIAKTFDYYYVAIFLVSANGRWAEIVDATGTAGEILKARRHRLQVGGSSMVGNAVATGQAQVAMDVGEAAVRFNNPLLPNTRSELALPLIVGERVIGALDVQSIREADFKQDDIATLQSLASQVAIAIENARLFREMEDALTELRQANRQYIRSAWQETLQAGKLEYAVQSAAMPEAETSKEISVNLNVRDQPIGYIRIQTSEDWTQEDQAWVESLATQVAISLENARLIEQSNQSALREQLSASIIQKLWSTPSVEGILQTAARELGRALEASEASIELKVEK
ncbi:MAG: hypothetical protein DDG60_12000 [Anaerolineae bacterium]|nr:MAG: hypothetical protein DDG60_12000 [Anaerolineae bacterium]